MRIIYARRLVARLRKWALKDTQRGFREGKGTQDQIFSKHITENVEKTEKKIHFYSIDMIEVFDKICK